MRSAGCSPDCTSSSPYPSCNCTGRDGDAVIRPPPRPATIADASPRLRSVAGVLRSVAGVLSDLVNPGECGLAALQVFLARVDVGLLRERRVIVTGPLAGGSFARALLGDRPYGRGGCRARLPRGGRPAALVVGVCTWLRDEEAWSRAEACQRDCLA